MIIDPKQWATPFGRFVRNYGAEKLAKDLGVTKSAVYHWTRGTAAPSPMTALQMIEFAARSSATLTLDDIYSQPQLATGLSFDEILDSEWAWPVPRRLQPGRAALLTFGEILAADA
jgi:DNA-binding XRE family transcriptional regulator